MHSIRCLEVRIGLMAFSAHRGTKSAIGSDYGQKRWHSSKASNQCTAACKMPQAARWKSQKETLIFSLGKYESFSLTDLSNFSIDVQIQLGLQSFPGKRGQFHQVLVEKHHTLHHVIDVL